MKEDFCTYYQALRLKKLGFDWECIAEYCAEPDGKPILVGSTAFVFRNSEEKGRDVTAPFLSQAQKWLRDVKGALLYVIPDRQPIDDDYNDIEFTGEWWWQIDGTVREYSGDTYKSYEAALSAGLDAALKLLEEKI